MAGREYLHMETDVPTVLSKTRSIPEVKIRPTALGDEIILGRLYAEAYFELMDQLPPPKSDTLEDFREVMTGLFVKASKENHKDIFRWIAECSGDAVGFLITRVAQDHGYVGEIGVIPLHRRKGIAQALLREFASFLKEKRIQRIKLDVNAKNTPALGLYESCGFKRIRKWSSQTLNSYSSPLLSVDIFVHIRLALR